MICIIKIQHCPGVNIFVNHACIILIQWILPLDIQITDEPPTLSLPSQQDSDRLKAIFDASLSIQQQVAICQITGTAVSGVYPFIFFERGQSHLPILSDVGVCGDAAYRSLRRVLDNGVTLKLPMKLVIEKG